MSQHGRTSRRGFLAMATAAATVPGGRALAQSGTPIPDESVLGRADAPAWVFLVDQVQDPYGGALQVPTEVPPGSRVVAVEVEVANESDQGLDFTPVDIRLRDEAGQEYRGGAAIGAEPMINPRNLNPAERSAGWVWFIVPEGTALTEIVYVAPQPQFRVTI